MRRPASVACALVVVATVLALLLHPPDFIVDKLDLDRAHGNGGGGMFFRQAKTTAQPAGNDPDPVGALLVSAYFPFSQAKHGADEYDAWMRLFLARMHAEIYLFCPPALAAKMRALRGDLPMTLDTTWTRPQDIPPLASPARRAQLAAQHALDREWYHNEDLYSVWAAKPFFVDAALRRTNHTYDFAFWMDIGTFRSEHPFSRWPEMRAAETFWDAGARLSGLPRDDLVLIPTQWKPPAATRTWNESQGPIDIDFAMGSMFGGPPRALEWFNRVYWTYFYHYIDRGLFVGKDQTMWNALMYLYPKRFLTVWANDPHTMPGHNYGEGAGDCGGWWGYYVYWLAPPKERHAVEDKFFVRRRCRRIRVLTVESILRRYLWFWSPPKPTLKLIDLPTTI